MKPYCLIAVLIPILISCSNVKHVGELDKLNSITQYEKVIIVFTDGSELKATNLSFAGNIFYWIDSTGRQGKASASDVNRVIINSSGATMG